MATTVATVALGVDTALASPRLLTLPFSVLDEFHEHNVVGICRERADPGDLVIVATHREDLLRQADCVLGLRDGMVIEWERPRAEALFQ